MNMDFTFVAQLAFCDKNMMLDAVSRQFEAYLTADSVDLAVPAVMWPVMSVQNITANPFTIVIEFFWGALAVKLNFVPHTQKLKFSAPKFWAFETNFR